MKLTLGPIVTDARGRFAGIVFSNWQGVATARRFVPPSQPRTVNQVNHRNLFRNLTQSYLRQANTIFRNSWARAATGRPGIGRNFFMKTAIENIGDDTDMEAFRAFYTNDELPSPTSVTVTPGDDELVVAWVDSTVNPPAGFTLAGTVVAGIDNDDPHGQDYEDELFVSSVESGTITLTLEGLQNATEYSVLVSHYYTVANETGIHAQSVSPSVHETGTTT